MHQLAGSVAHRDMMRIALADMQHMHRQATEYTVDPKPGMVVSMIVKHKDTFSAHMADFFQSALVKHRIGLAEHYCNDCHAPTVVHISSTVHAL